MGARWGPLPYHRKLVVTQDTRSKTNLSAETWGEELGAATEGVGRTAGMGETGAEEGRHRGAGAPTGQRSAERTPWTPAQKLRTWPAFLVPAG